MANKILAAMTPGLLDHVGTVEMRFTSPKNAKDVKISIFEANSWKIDGRTVREGRSDDLRAEIFGSIEDSKFKYKTINTWIKWVVGQEGHVVPITFMNLTVKIDDTTCRVPLQNIDREKEHGFFEITFTVTANVDGVAEEYKSRSPVFIRNIPAPRALATFISGRPADFQEPETKTYFPRAEMYWKQARDNAVSNILSLEGILNYLGDRDARALERRNGLPWGRVNVVSHGNRWTWFIRVKESDSELSRLGPGDLASADMGSARPPGPGDLDERSIVVICACNVGLSQRLLDAIREEFGGRAAVFGPKHSLAYRQERDGWRERLFQYWSLQRPGRGGFPPEDELKRALHAKYSDDPLYGSYTDSDWTRVARITSSNNQGDAFRTSMVWGTGEQIVSNLPEEEVYKTRNGGKTQKNQAELTLLMKQELTTGDDPPMTGDEFDSYEWRWSVTRDRPPANPPTYTVTGTGTQTFLEIFRLLTKTENGRTVPATPDLNDPFHFGRSPAR
jgi:hypothetical protein